jgi:hypothetical protein
VIQQGQVFKLKAKGADGERLWAYRYRLEGRTSMRPQMGGFATRGGSTEGTTKGARSRRSRPVNELATLSISIVLRRSR